MQISTIIFRKKINLTNKVVLMKKCIKASTFMLILTLIKKKKKEIANFSLSDLLLFCQYVNKPAELSSSLEQILCTLR